MRFLTADRAARQKWTKMKASGHYSSRLSACSGVTGVRFFQQQCFSCFWISEIREHLKVNNHVGFFVDPFWLATSPG